MPRSQRRSGPLAQTSNVFQVRIEEYCQGQMPWFILNDPLGEQLTSGQMNHTFTQAIFVVYKLIHRASVVSSRCDGQTKSVRTFDSSWNLAKRLPRDLKSSALDQFLRQMMCYFAANFSRKDITGEAFPDNDEDFLNIVCQRTVVRISFPRRWSSEATANITASPKVIYRCQDGRYRWDFWEARVPHSLIERTLISGFHMLELFP